MRGRPTTRAARGEEEGGEGGGGGAADEVVDLAHEFAEQVVPACAIDGTFDDGDGRGDAGDEVADGDAGAHVSEIDGDEAHGGRGRD